MNEKRKNLKVTKETETGRNLEFVNLNSGIHFTLEHAIEQIEKGIRCPSLSRQKI